MDRRTFMQQVGVTTTAGVLANQSWAAEKPKLKKAVKYGMIQVPGASIEEKLALVKSLGFEGVEIQSPDEGLNKQELIAARDKTGVLIHGVIDAVHWKLRLSDPDPAVRAKSVAALQVAIADAKLVGADTVLVVPGKVTDEKNENFDQVWERSHAEIRKVLPQCEQTGVKIAIEVVWNDFLTTPENLIKYVDQFGSPYVGAYFDCSNMLKYGVPSATWIRMLGKRMLKFDFKGYEHRRKWVDIGEGDENWPEILKALGEIGYNGWATSEVKGGGKEHLAEIARRMNKVLGLD